MAQPKSARGSKRAVEVSCAAWIDLLGYGSMLREVNFDPTAAEAQAAISRLNRFQEVLNEHAGKYSPILVINDGAVVFRDLSPRSRDVTYDFIERVIDIHNDIKSQEIALGYPGARTVVAVGFRMRRKHISKDKLLNGIGLSLIRRVVENKINITQAVSTAITIKPYFAQVPEVQANFAFAKAYLADKDGSSAGLSGPRVFLDAMLFHEPLPQWIGAEELIPWRTEGMSTTFVAIGHWDSDAAGRAQYQGVRDAYEIAESLTASGEIVDRLRALRVRPRANK